MVEVRQEARVRHLRDAGRLTLPQSALVSI
jgi:hypothetical protein